APARSVAERAKSPTTAFPSWSRASSKSPIRRPPARPTRTSSHASLACSATHRIGSGYRAFLHRSIRGGNGFPASCAARHAFVLAEAELSGCRTDPHSQPGDPFAHGTTIKKTGRLGARFQAIRQRGGRHRIVLLVLLLWRVHAPTRCYRIGFSGSPSSPPWWPA